MLRGLLASFSLVGLMMGLLFLCASLTPSLLPRVPLVQGVLSGIAFAVGYGVGKALLGTYCFLEFKELSGRVRQPIVWGLFVSLAVLTLITFSRNGVWQNSIRERMEMPAIDRDYLWLVAGIALVVALVVVFFARAIRYLAHLIGRLLQRVLPRRTAVVLGALGAAVLVFVSLNDLVLQRFFQSVDDGFAVIDLVVEDGMEPPVSEVASGGPNSVIDWNDIGFNGKSFLTAGPDRSSIEAFTGRQAQEPIRVYAGYNSGETFEERAALALQDLIAMGGFERSVLVVATPTGTGWLDPAAVEPVAFLQDGDLAIVSLQYSYVPSWLSLIVDPDRSRRAAQALFDAVYGHWLTVPDNERPELFAFGLSLGALGSESSADLVTLFNDPIDGALWSGPPFASSVWASVTRARNDDSPAWRPEFRDGALVRFMNQDGIANPVDARWGPMRLLYLQYASDPMVFFSTRLAWNRPDWLEGERGPDISPFFDWYPLVTFLQVAFDIPMATSPPSGFGHSYHARDYIEGWVEVMQPEGWTLADTERLQALYADFEASPSRP
ncbi:MAG: alpha/beta-hydrolase family protein [Hyphomicrobiales bacterium]